MTNAHFDQDSSVSHYGGIFFDSEGIAGIRRLMDIREEAAKTPKDKGAKKIIELALRFKASSAVIAHNHPSGVSYPSQKDSESTIKIKNALNNVNVILKNHYIVAANNAFSMADSEEFFDLFL